MPRSIWRYILPRGDYVPLELPRNAQFLHLHQQNDTEIGLWFLMDMQKPKVTRYFTTTMTEGAAPPLAAKYLGTAHLESGSLAVHVFEVYDGGDVQHLLFQ
jgi:hypothetical protein